MKKFAILLIAAIGIAAAVYKTGTQVQQPTPIPYSTSLPPIVLSLKGEEFAAQSVLIERHDQITLLPNFEEKLASKELREIHNCKSLINGGFYTPEITPTGLFITENKVIRQPVASTLTDGFIISDGNTVYIGTVPQNNARWALQAGPLLFLNGTQRTLSFVRDEPARRVIAIKSARGHIYFVIIYKTGSAFSGPKLVDLPALVNEFAKKINIEVTDAINLDGGSASAFLSGSVDLTEISQIGSFFCVK
jgi:uncharacterized protein YigE (DUF2233 family)